MSPPPAEETEQAHTVETRALYLSIVATAVLGSGALLWGVLSGARVILFDGVYMLAGIALVTVSLVASRASSRAPSPEYPFGRHAATPLAVALQGAALLGTLIYGAADAIGVLLEGGSGAAALSVLLYGVISGLASVIVMLLLRRAGRVSALAQAEVVSWRAGALLSLVVAVGGVVAVLLYANGLGHLAAFIDPILVLIACVGIAPMAIQLVREGVGELLEASPGPDLRARIAAAVAEGAAAACDSGRTLPEPIIRSTKLGQRLYVEVDFLVPCGRWQVDDEDVVRNAITDRLDRLGLLVWATVTLTTDSVLTQD